MIFALTQTLLIFSELKYAQIKGIVDTENEKKSLYPQWKM